MRKLALAAAVSMSLANISSETFALGMGEIEIFSALNQKLDAEIGLLRVGAGELDGATVKLASEQAFSRVGLSVSPVLRSLRFDVEQRPDGESIIKVLSDAPIAEPFLNFLVEIDSPAIASQVREYTLLLDPPSFVTQQAPLIADPVATLEPLQSVEVSEILIDNPVETSGASIDLSSIEVDVASVEPTVIYTEQEVLQLGSESTGAVAPIVEPSPFTDSTVSVEDVGEEIDLGDELITGAAPVFEDSAIGEDIVLDSLVDSETGIFPSEDANLIDLSSLGNEPVAAVSADINQVSDELQQEGLNVDLDTVEPDLENFSVDVSGDDRPQVTLEAIETIRIDGIRAPDTVATDTGEAMDISGVVVVEDAEVIAPTTAPGELVSVSTSTSTYTVQSQDTLWSIARRSKPDGVTTREMMSTILAANSKAFVNGDMNTLRAGAQLNIPGATGRLAASDTAAIEPNSTTDQITAVVVEDTAPQEMTVTDTAPANTNTGGQLATELDEVDKRMMIAQEELSSEAQQRNELSNRVGELEDSLTKMKDLITLRESEISNLRTEFSPETDTAAVENSDAAGEPEVVVGDAGDAEEIPEKFKQLEAQISENATLAKEAVEAEADAQRNLASAQAQAKSLQLANEEDALKVQLAQLRAEKQQLLETSQQDKLELVQQAEAEKAVLLDNAAAERDRILATLEAEKQRISDDAASERARIAVEAEAEKERLLAEASAERDQLAAESEEMRRKLEALEEEKNQLLAQSEIDKEQLALANEKAEQEQARLQAEAQAEKKKLEEESSRAKDKLAALQAEADANLANNTSNATIDRTAGSTDGESSIVDIAVPAVVGGGLAAAPLEKVLGDRKTVLAAGGGLAFLGLLGAWAARRKKAAAVEARRDNRAEFDEDAMGSPVPTQYHDNRNTPYEEVEDNRQNMGQAAVAASAAAAATGAAVVTRDTSAQDDDAVQAEDTQYSDPAAHPMIDNVLVDDTITEADVYLRYGLHGQAEDLLKASIEKSPDVEEYQVKLLESYHDQNNTAEFKNAAQSFKDRFGESANWPRIAEMGRDIDSADSDFSRVGAMGAVASAAAVATPSAYKPEIPDVVVSADSADDTIDAAADFNMADLEATGDLSAVTDSLPDDLDEISLDEVDLAALDDDGTLNLEEFTGDHMSGLDLGTLDLTNPVGDSTLDNLTLDDADLKDLGDVTSNVRSGLSSDIDLDDGAISRADEMETMLDLAKAYIDMGDSDSAAGALKDIVNNGSEAQKHEAQDLLRKLR